jgi:hypothetical protein
MSSDDLHASTRTAKADSPASTTPADTRRLLRSVDGTERDTTPEAVMSAVAGDLFDGDVDDVSVPRELVTHTLDELLLALVALCEDGTHGTGLMENVGHLFDVDPSPGTVYPRLHNLESGGTLARHDMVKTKQYDVADRGAAADRVERAMYQHLAVGLFLREALEELR